MNQTKPKPSPFSFSRFLTSSLGYFIIFAAILGGFYFIDPAMLEYNFLFTSSAIVAIVLGIYHGKYKKQADVDTAVNADVAHVEEEIKEEVEEIKEKLHK
jgi:uncharacterized membrane protein